jgi:uncharacterized protein YkuJ
MTLNELIEQLQTLQSEGRGNYEVFDTDANPIISVTHSEQDEAEGLFRTYIEAEF